MEQPITLHSRPSIENEAFKRYAESLVDIERDFHQAIGSFGLAVADESSEFDERVRRLRDLGVSIENDCKSFHTGWISPACVACRKGVGTETFLTSTQCPRTCFFCFNPNQEDYEHGLTHVNDIAGRLRERVEQGARYTQLGITGGEPLLHAGVVLDFLGAARTLAPDARVRLYTSGAGLTEALARDLAATGLHELRFSVKLDEPRASLDRTLARIGMCAHLFDAVMVEMPVMPDQADAMKQLLVRLDNLGVRAINLLELCFPLHNADEFARRGYRIKRRPYRVPYEYWYAGGLPIAGSEDACFDLLEFAVRERLRMGVHYCSLENKLTGQVYQQNRFIEIESACHAQSPDDFFLKSAKVFGVDRVLARAYLESIGEQSFSENDEHDYLEFPISRIDEVAAAIPAIEICISTSIAEMRMGHPVIRELAIAKWSSLTNW